MGWSGEDPLYRDPRLAEFYDIDNGWGADHEYCRRLAAAADAVLDLGCGTGRLAAALALDGRGVIGADPASAMLAIARNRPGGDRVTWVEADARHMRLGRRFDLILLTGHAFQVFLSDEDQKAVLATIAAHLAPGGRFIFDSRNPLAEEWREWGPELSRRLLHHPRYGEVEAWNDAQHDSTAGIATYRTHYRVSATGATLSAQSQIRFTPQSRLAELIAESGLTIDRWFGGWDGSALTANSPELIPLGRLSG
jgi:SAM-dependent methyltransferase